MILKILATPAGEEFDRQVAGYTEHMSADVLRFPKLIKKIAEHQGDTDYFYRYAVYMRWGVRKLEYAFVIDNLPKTDNLQILDMGCGVTILPNVLSKMGHKVDALDPDEEWKLADSRISNLYNDFYRSNVNYINDHIYGILGGECYDVIISVSVLEHLVKDELKKTINKILSLLKPGGRLIMTIDYCPRVTLSRHMVIHRLLLSLKGRLGLHIEVRQGGFSYEDFVKMLYVNLPEHGDLSDLWRQDRFATPYKEFWSSHAFEGCLYEDYRPYVALGICCTKPLGKAT